MSDSKNDQTNDPKSDPKGRPNLRSTGGTIWAVFGHRLAIEGPDGRVLVDLGPEGARTVSLVPGDSVAVTGEVRPSEIKATEITLADGTRHAIAWPKPHHPKPHHPKPAHHAKPDAAKADAAAVDLAVADPAIALAAVEQAGYRPAGAALRKPRHFEIPATRDGRAFALHVTLDGAIRKAKAVEAGFAAA